MEPSRSVQAGGRAAVAIGGDAHGPVMTNPVFAGPATPLAVAVKSPLGIFNAVSLDSFTGREWLIAEIDEWLGRHDSGHLWIESEAGLGKTTLAAWLVRERGWFSHFARYTQGSSARVALQNIAGQLVRAYGLDEFAPGGMLPEWVHTPSGFEAVLTAASTRAADCDRPLVIVVDGADEAECTDDGLPWGLPPVLPHGVRVIGTYRTGSDHALPPDSSVLRIDRSDAHNIDDIRAYLERALGDPEIRARLDGAGTDRGAVVRSLVERTGGIWVYLRYVLRQIATGRQGVGDLDDLPAGLSAYYAAEVARWRLEPDWETVGARLLSTLVAAGEPLGPETLARLSGVADTGSVRRWCDATLRPFLSAWSAPARSYELYHASAREFFGGEPPAGTAAQDRLLALAAELKSRTTAAHARISQHYLDAYGGLADGLPLLADDPSLGGLDGGYALRHLSTHLLAARSPERLHGLLTAEAGRGPYAAENIWFTAHDHAGSTDAYLDDIARAQQAAERATEEALRKRRPAPSFVHELRYAWMRASIRNLTDQIQPRLLERLVATGVWGLERGLAHARRASDPFQKARALLALHPHVEAGLRDGLAEEALRAARERGSITRFGLLDFRIESPAMVLAFLPAGRRAALAEELFRELEQKAFHDASTRAEYMGELIEHLPPERRSAVARSVWRAATSASRGIVFTQAVVATVCRALPWLTPEERAEAIAEALTVIRKNWAAGSPVEGYRELLPHLAEDQWEAAWHRALEAARSGEFAQHAPQFIAALLPCAPNAQRRALFEEAWARVRSLPRGPSRENAVIALLPHMAEEQRNAELSHLLSEPALRYATLDQLAPWLSAAQLREALRRVRLRDVHARVDRLTALVPLLPPDRRDTAGDFVVGLAHSAPPGGTRALALGSVLPLLPVERRGDVAAEALRHTEDISSPTDELEALDLLVPHVGAETRASVIGRAFDAWAAIGLPMHHIGPLRHFPGLFPQELMAEALAGMREEPFVSDTLAWLSPHLDQENLERALDIARGRPEALDRANAMLGIAASLAPRQLELVLADLRAMKPDVSAYALPRLVRFLPPAQRAEVAAESVGIARKSRYEGAFAQAVADVHEYLGEAQEDRDRLVAEALASPPNHRTLHTRSALLPALAEPRRREVAAELVELSRTSPENPHGAPPGGLIDRFTPAWVDALLLTDDPRPLGPGYLRADCGDGYEGLLRFARLFRRCAPWAEPGLLLPAAETVLRRYADQIGPPQAVFDAMDDVLTWWP
ncbi:hypothetical protein [Streptomyces sp. NPDC057257]|uniref:hypothetical protein n=1 Tax=Streptomyces sp. NPDC057257 TaxID=3346071 RepID=UPI00362EC44E